MSGRGSDRKPRPGGFAPAGRLASGAGRSLAAAALVAGLAAGAPARAGESLWDAALEKLNLKATPAAPPPDFVERTRPDPADLGYQATALPHKVSPLPVKSAAQVEAAKSALDAAKVHQLAPGAPQPLQIAKDRKAGAAKPASKTAD